MKYPNKMVINGHTIEVEATENPLYQFYTCPTCHMPRNPDKPYRFVLDFDVKDEDKWCPACKRKDIQPQPNSYAIGEYRTNESKIRHYVNDSTEKTRTLCASNFVHETLEAIDAICDLKLNHTQISTLAASLYSAFSSGDVDFGMAA